MARTTFDGPVRSRNGFEGDVTPVGPVKLPFYEEDAGLPPAEGHPNSIAVSGESGLVISNGTAWEPLAGGGGGGGGGGEGG